MVIDLTQYGDIKEEIYTILLKCVYILLIQDNLQHLSPIKRAYIHKNQILYQTTT